LHSTVVTPTDLLTNPTLPKQKKQKQQKRSKKVGIFRRLTSTMKKVGRKSVVSDPVVKAAVRQFVLERTIPAANRVVKKQKEDPTSDSTDNVNVIAVRYLTCSISTLYQKSQLVSCDD